MRVSSLVFASVIAAAGLADVAAAGKIAEPLDKADYESEKDTKGVVLLGVRWDRRWGCGGYENAQLKVIGFDKLPSTKVGDDAPADILLADAPLIMTKPKFDNYAFLVEPGQYGLSGVLIKVAQSMSKVGHIAAPRSKMITEGISEGGSFSVSAGEIVYIGHFYLDCLQTPIIWRYYADGREAFDSFLAEFKKDFPVLDTSKVVYRLFETKVFGHPYQLP